MKNLCIALLLVAGLTLGNFAKAELIIVPDKPAEFQPLISGNLIMQNGSFTATVQNSEDLKVALPYVGSTEPHFTVLVNGYLLTFYQYQTRVIISSLSDSAKNQEFKGLGSIIFSLDASGTKATILCDSYSLVPLPTIDLTRGTDYKLPGVR